MYTEQQHKKVASKTIEIFSKKQNEGGGKSITCLSRNEEGNFFSVFSIERDVHKSRCN